MANRTIFINFNNGDVIDSEGAFLMSTPSIGYQSYPKWELKFVKVNEDGSLEGVDMSSAVSWHAAVDTDFNSSTSPMVRTLDNEIDSSGASSGVIVVGLDAGTQGFYDKVNGRESVNAVFEIRGNDSTDRVIYDYRFRVTALGAVDPQGGDPLPIVSGGVTINDVYALLRAAPERRWSEDGVNWHPTQAANDRWYQTRYDSEGEWSEPIALLNGRDGYNVAFRYSSDSLDWHSAPLSTDYYMSMSNDGEASWTSGVLFRGSDGVGWSLCGEWSAEAVYRPKGESSEYAVVVHGGSSYAFIGDEPTSGAVPGSSVLWQLIASKGDSGDVGSVTADKVIGLDGTISSVVSEGWYDKAHIDARLSGLDADNFYTKRQTDTLLAQRMPADQAYTKAQADSKLALKANTADVYSKAQVNLMLDGVTSGYVPLSTYNEDMTGVGNSLTDLTIAVEGKLGKTVVYDIGEVSESISYSIHNGDYQTVSLAAGATVTVGSTSFIGFTQGDGAALQVTKGAGSQLIYNGKAILADSASGVFLIGVICPAEGSIRLTSPTELI